MIVVQTSAFLICTTLVPVSVKLSCPSALTVKGVSGLLGFTSTVTTSSAETTIGLLVRV